jgi:hypothetical protein
MRQLILQFATDRRTYTDEDVYMRGHRCNGIVKAIVEEYEPLAALVDNLPHVRRARLLPIGTKGHDAEIWLRRRHPVGVQITCATQSHHVALQRMELASGKAVFPFLRRSLDEGTRKGVLEGRTLANPEAVIDERIERIRKAIQKKCNKYRGNSEILLIADDSAHWKYLERARFIPRVHGMFSTLRNIPYTGVYVCFGNVVVNLRAEND